MLFNRKLFRTAASLAIAAAMVPLSGLMPAQQLAAGDFEGQTAAEETDNGHFVRIGLNKSVVIKLPGNAKDVIVGDPAIVDAVVRSKNTAYLFARGVGQTNIFFFDAEGRQIMNIDLEVALDSKALQKLIKRTIPGSHVTVDTINQSVILSGTAANATEAKMAEDLAMRFVNATGTSTNVLNTMTVLGQDQVMLKVRVVEVQRNILKQLGVDLSAALDIGKLAASLVSNNPIAGLSTGYRGRLAYDGDSFDISATIKALESDGVLHTLAEPTLTAVSGQPANFNAGGEVPIGVTCTGTGDDRSCATEYKAFGIALKFLPVVLNQGRISLNVRTEVSDVGAPIDGRTSFVTRNAETVIELPSGGSMMLAGLIKDVSTQSIDGTPGLKNLPILGALFRSREYTQKQTELVVIVTPYIVNPVNEGQLATPADHYNTATDRQTILWGRLNRVYGTPGKHPDGVYHGNVGFIVE